MTIKRPYQPIPCDVYSHYELAIMQRKRLRLAWQARTGTRIEMLRPLDLRTYRGGEYLIARSLHHDCPRVLRLDRIRAAIEC